MTGTFLCYKDMINCAFVPNKGIAKEQFAMSDITVRK